MKEVILSADSSYVVYSVPDIVSEHLDEYCLEFCKEWLPTSPLADENGVMCYDEKDFILYLNFILFPDMKSEKVTDIAGEIPDKHFSVHQAPISIECCSIDRKIQDLIDK